MTEQQLPEGWQMVKFGDIAKHISKRVEPTETDLEVYVGLEHLDPDSLKIKRHGVPSDVVGQKLLVKKGQIIFGKRRAYQRKVAVTGWDCICSAHAMVLEENTENIVPGFLPIFMQSDVFMQRAVSISEGSLSPTIKWKSLANQKFTVIEDETDIKARLDKICKFDLAISKAEVAMTEAKKLVDVLLEQRIWRSAGEEALLGEKRPTLQLKEVAKVEPGYAFKSKDSVPKGARWLKIANVGLGEGVWEEKSYLPESFLESHSQFVLKQGDLVMAMTRPVLSGRLKLAKLTDKDVPALLNQRVCRITSNGESYTDEQLSILLRSKHVVRNINVCILGTDPPNISSKEIEKLPIPLVNNEERQEVFNAILELNELIRLLDDKVKYLNKMRRETINSMVR
ncbi:restriction endonuclease subunit S [Vibrio splendidus]